MQAEVRKAGEFGFVVNDVAERQEAAAFCESLLGAGDGADNPAAETGPPVYLHLHHCRIPNLP